jgi:hypothetical protein
MNHKYNVLAGLLALLCTAAGAPALEIGADLKFGNLGFGRAASVPVSFSASTFQKGFDLFATDTIGENFNFEAGFDFDPILRNTAYTQIKYTSTIAQLGIGPFFGMFNSTGMPLKSGLSTSIRLEIPGAVFISFRSDSSIGGGIVKTGDYLQERNNIAAGFYVRNAICSLNLNSKKFQQKTSDTPLLSTEFTEYAFKVEVFKKNVPYVVVLNFAFQELAVSDGDLTANLNSLVLGTKLSFQVNPTLRTIVDLESNLYSFGQGTLSGQSIPNGTYLFRVTAGAVITLETRK